jgi:Mn-dependent DtxR family transcriptional regulator
MATLPATERDALKVIRELEKLGEVNAEAAGRELGFSVEYATILCRSLWKSGYIRGTTISGYEIMEKGEKFLLELEKS